MTGAASDPVIVGVGTMTAVGLSAVETATSVGSGIMRFEESSILDSRFEAVVMAQVHADALPPLADDLNDVILTGRESRMIRLATIPLLECVAAAPDDVRPLPIILGLPDPTSTRPTDPDTFTRALATQVSGLLDSDRMAAPFTGRAGGIVSIGRAADVVRAGEADFIVAGGVDSYRDLMLLATMEDEGRLKTSTCSDGLIPGEGAGFVLLTRRSIASMRGLPVLSSVVDWAHGHEPGHLYSDEPYSGTGLATTVAAALRDRTAVHDVYSTMNGESHWAKEWGVTYLRNRDAFADDVEHHHPADCYGDTGAAAGPLLTVLAAMGLASSSRRSPCLIYASSDRGERAALLLSV